MGSSGVETKVTPICHFRLRLRPLRRDLEPRLHAVRPRLPAASLTPLPKPSIDTGMGLERVAAVLQGVVSNYDTDLFTPLIERAAELTGASIWRRNWRQKHRRRSAASLRIIADHARAATFLISDGVLPSNEGRGYVLRKIMRRGISPRTIARPGKAIPVPDGLCRPRPDAGCISRTDRDRGARVESVLSEEEQRFAHTMDIGLKKLEEDMHLCEGQRQAAATTTGEKAFQLYDTFGMPLDFIQDAARDQGIEFRPGGFDPAMQEQRERARASWKGAAKQTANPAYQQLPKSDFRRLPPNALRGCEVLAIIHKGQGVKELKPGEEGEIVLDHTPFYAESGGQVGDRGWFYSDDTTPSSPK